MSNSSPRGDDGGRGTAEDSGSFVFLCLGLRHRLREEFQVAGHGDGMRLKLSLAEPPSPRAASPVPRPAVNQAFTFASSAIRVSDLRTAPVFARLPQFLFVRMQAHAMTALPLAATCLPVLAVPACLLRPTIGGNVDLVLGGPNHLVVSRGNSSSAGGGQGREVEVDAVSAQTPLRSFAGRR